METSRIFIRGLPPNLSEDEFKAHFSKLCPVTDAKFIPRRRIGYVGYKTPADAAKAVKYFDRSFIRMSRIAVELAKPIEDRKVLAPVNNRENDSGETNSPAKRKATEAETTVDNPKLREYLEVMQPPSKSKTWANEDHAISGAKESEVEKPVETMPDDGLSNDEYVRMVKKRKISPVAPPIPEKASSKEEALVGSDTTIAENEAGVALDGSKAVKVSTSPLVGQVSFSDSDWLRSHTSRLLGLVDNDDDIVSSQGLEFESDPVPDAEPEVHTEIPEQTPAADSRIEVELSKQDTSEISIDGDININPPSTGRLFLRNLSYAVNSNELRDFFSKYGILTEVHVPIDARSGTPKGFAYVEYEDPKDARQAMDDLDGKPFQGRLLHILPASAKKQRVLDDYETSKLPLKKQRLIRMKAEASSSTFRWNSLYMSLDAVMSSISDRMGIPKSQILDPTSSDTAVKQAHAETSVIQETKAYFAACGIDLEAFKMHEFSDTALLVKNFPYGTSLEELRSLFEAHGSIKKLLMPPSGTIAIVEFELPAQARAAFGAVSYRKFKDSILFLEKAPKGLFDGQKALANEVMGVNSKSAKASAADILEGVQEQVTDSSTLFVRDLNFSTTNERLREVFQPLDGLVSARVKTKQDPKKPGQILSMGFGFLEFRTKEQAQAAMTAMNGYKLDGHELVIKSSHRAIDAAEERRNEDKAKKLAGRRTKIIIKNLPFEASKKDIQALFGAYGKLQSVRVPKKFDSSTRGFAFANFITTKEAENAMDALANTHLLGRRLVLEYAAEEATDPEDEIEKMQQKVGRQTDKVALRNLTSVGRRKFAVKGVGDPDEEQ